MRDPHVESLEYKLQTAETLFFKAPPPIDGDETDFKYRLENGCLTVTMKTHFATEKEARAAVEPFLRAWELDHATGQGRSEIAFAFDKRTIIDRNPPKPGEPQVIHVDSVINVESVVGTPSLVSYSSTYPPPPTRFVASPDVEALWFRYEQFLKGREPLLSMAYAVLSFIEGSTGRKKGRRDKAAEMYSIDRDILNQIGKLVSTRGTMEQARKLNVGAKMYQLTGAEDKWLRKAILKLIRRKAEYDADSTTPFTQIRMADI